MVNFFLSNWSSMANGNVVQAFVGVERSVIGNILNVIRIFGSGLALIMLTWMSISYFTADGRGVPWSAEKKANIKGEQLRNFAIGVAVFIAASNIVYFIANFVEDVITA